MSVPYTFGNVHTGVLPLSQLEAPRFKYVIVEWADVSGVIREWVFTLSYFKKLLQTSRPGFPIASIALTSVFTNLPPTIEGGISEYLVAVDLSTLRPCPYLPDYAVVHPFFEERVPVSNDSGLSVEVSHCPRTLLRRLVREAKEKHDLGFLVGFESEFFLLESTRPFKLANPGSYIGNPFGASKVDQKVLSDIASNIQEAGIELQCYHFEGSPGQYEIIAEPLPPLEAVDALINTRQIIVNVASKYGLRATFAPRVDANSGFSGCHAHISVHNTSNLHPAPTEHPYLSAFESSFLAGLLDHYPAIAALMLPIPASYARVVDGMWCGGTWVAWGVDNKDVPVRLCNAQSPLSRNFEIKTIDGVANPYYALAGVIAAGMSGVAKGEAPTQGSSAGIPPAQMSDLERAELHIHKRLPMNLEEANANLQGDETIVRAFGSDVIETYLMVNKLLTSVIGEGSEEDASARLIEYF